MEAIDAAAEQLSNLMAEIAGYQDTIRSEQDTRLKVINRILTEVLGWSLEDISTEEQSGTGFIDYKLSISGRARVIVEAKRDGRDLGFKGRTAGRAFKLDGPTFSSLDVKEGLAQAIRYCGQKNAELACVTNGQEWVVFRGSRLGDGLDTMEGKAFVFPSLEDVHTEFARFYDLLSYESVTLYRYRAIFQEEEGRTIRRHLFRQPLRDRHSRRLMQTHKLALDLDRVMNSFFQRLTGDEDPDLLTRCFVVTKESSTADERLVRMSEDLVGRVRELDTASGVQLTELVERVKQTHRNAFVLVVGTKGAGKSTFIDRFFRHVIPTDVLEWCVVARVNVADSGGDESQIVTWLDRNLLDILEMEVFGGSFPDYDELQGMFFDEYQRLSRGPWHHLYESDKSAFKIDFGKHVERRREERPHEYIQRLVRHIVNNHKKVPCLVFDNADHFTIEFQERVFQYARSIYEGALCLVILPVTDRTSWQLSREGALRSFENEALYLPTPTPRTVLQKRIEYMESKLADQNPESGHGYFFTRGISLSIENLKAFSAALQTIFIRASDVSEWIGNFANHDIRQCLELARTIVTSPHLSVDELVVAFAAEQMPEKGRLRDHRGQRTSMAEKTRRVNTTIPPHKIKRAIIRGRYDIYSSEVNKFIRNIYALEDEIETSPLMGLRILALLEDARHSPSGDAFITVDQVVQYFRAMQVEPQETLPWLSYLLNSALCLSYDPTVTTISSVSKVELSPAGYQHLRWGIGDVDYLQAMLEVTPLVERQVFDRLVNLNQRPMREVWQEKVKVFVEHLIEEDARFCKPSDHEAYASQRRLTADLGSIIVKVEALAASLGAQPSAAASGTRLTSPGVKPRRRGPRQRAGQRIVPAVPSPRHGGIELNH
jgi:GTPase SAR1 family protein